MPLANLLSDLSMLKPLLQWRAMAYMAVESYARVLVSLRPGFRSVDVNGRLACDQRL